MELRVFQADKGDTLLLTSRDGRRILCDGGMSESYVEHVAPYLGTLADDDAALDVVYLSHIDRDHIAGILRLMDDVVAWRVHDYQVETGNARHRAPSNPRPPQIDGIWHNAFHDVLGENAGPIEDMLAASAAVLSGHPGAEIRDAAAASGELATSVKEALQLTRRVGERQLDIPLNAPADGQLMMVRSSKKAIRLGALRLYVLAPFAEDLHTLREEWNAWLRKNKTALADLRARARRDEASLSDSSSERVLAPLLTQAAKFGDRGQVTTPNLASLMFFVEEHGTDATALLTGDGHPTDIIKGLNHYGKLSASGTLHVSVLKVPHHGSEYNMTTEFARAITADHYVFCANGAHRNPDLETVEVLLNSRLGSGAARSESPEADGRFTFWFNSHPDISGGTSDAGHLRKVEALVRAHAVRSRGRLRVKWLKGSSFAFSVS